jgi:hypothetical protein
MCDKCLVITQYLIDNADKSSEAKFKTAKQRHSETLLFAYQICSHILKFEESLDFINQELALQEDINGGKDNEHYCYSLFLKAKVLTTMTVKQDEKEGQLRLIKESVGSIDEALAI